MRTCLSDFLWWIVVLQNSNIYIMNRNWENIITILYQIISCRYNSGRLPTAFHLDCALVSSVSLSLKYLLIAYL